MASAQIASSLASLAPPKYDVNEDAHLYFSKLKKYEVELKRHNYLIILEFINSWLSLYNIKLKSLSEFKNIEKTKICSDANIEFFNQNYVSINPSYKCNEVNPNTIFDLINAKLKAIGYTFTSKTKDKKIFVSIVAF